MGEWISVKDKLPAVSEEVLLFVKQYRSDSGAEWADHIVTGFWSDEFEDDIKGFYITNFTFMHLGCKHNDLDGVCNYEYISDCEYLKITHWISLPFPPELPK